MLVRIALVTLLAVVLIMSSIATVLAQPTRPQLVAASAIAVDVGSGEILFQHNADDRRAMASLTKIFTAYFAIETTPLDRRMTVIDEDLVGEASAGLDAGDNLSLETLLHGLMLPSGNDAAMTIARNIGRSRVGAGASGISGFESYVNDRLETIGLHDTHIANPHGLDQPGHYSTARDIAAFTLFALQNEPDFLRIAGAASYSGDGFVYQHRHQLVGIHPGVVGGKTGMTDDAGFSLMTIAQRDGRTIVTVILGSTADAWYSDTIALLDFGFALPASQAPPVAVPASNPISVADTATTIVNGMAVQTIDSTTLSVQPVALARINSWSVLRWPVGAVLAMIVGLVVVVQTRALIELHKLPRARSRRRPVPVRYQAASAPVRQAPQRRSTTRRYRHRRPAVPQPPRVLSPSPDFGREAQPAPAQAWDRPVRSWSTGD